MLITQNTQNIIDKLRFNKSYVSAYLELLEKDIQNKEKNEATAKVYLSEILMFIEYFDQLGIGVKELLKKLPNTNEIEEYTKSKGVDVDSVFKIALKGLFKEVNRTTNTNIENNTIDIAITKLPGKKVPQRPSRPLSIDEIIKIRNKLQKNGKYLQLFTFEMFYAYGISLDEIETFGNSTYSSQNNEFSFFDKKENKNRIIKLSKAIIELVNKHPELLEVKSRIVYSNNRKAIGSIFEDNKLLWHDIIDTREYYFPRCPKCEQKYPNSDEFWVLVKNDLDKFNKKWFYCRDCARKMVNGEE